ncbi:MAG: hypothetical protein ACYCU7_07085 [Acidimicrobiales bacterium]
MLDVLTGISLGAGGGRGEVWQVSGADVEEQPSGVVAVRFPDGRFVPVTPGRAGTVRHLASQAPHGPFGGASAGRDWHRLTRIASACGTELNPTRFRASWLVEHLRRGVPLQVLTVGAGARLSQLNTLVSHLSGRPEAERLAWLVDAAHP